MPWKEMSVMSQRREFVELAQAAGTNKRGLCRRFGISPTTGYKWLGRFCERSDAGLVDLPRRPHHSPARTPPQVEQAVMSAREAHPAWGARMSRAERKRTSGAEQNRTTERHVVKHQGPGGVRARFRQLPEVGWTSCCA